MDMDCRECSLPFLLIPEGESWMKKTIFSPGQKTLPNTRFYRLEMPFLDKFMGFGHFSEAFTSLYAFHEPFTVRAGEYCVEMCAVVCASCRGWR